MTAVTLRCDVLQHMLNLMCVRRSAILVASASQGLITIYGLKC